ncbi:MAG: aminopeptidase N, partial [Actinomycetes bacterium]
MPAENLTRLEAIERAELVEVLSYTVELDLLKGEEVFGATTTVKFNSHKIGASIFIDAITKTVHRVTLNGKDLDVTAVSDGIRIQLDNLEAENELVVVSDNPYMNTGEGLHRFVDPVDQEVYLYTQFEV